MTLWWTWMASPCSTTAAGDDKRTPDRLFVLAGHESRGAIGGDPATTSSRDTRRCFALALAGCGWSWRSRTGGRPEGELTQNRIGWGYALSTLLFVASAFRLLPVAVCAVGVRAVAGGRLPVARRPRTP